MEVEPIRRQRRPPCRAGNPHEPLHLEASFFQQAIQLRQIAPSPLRVLFAECLQLIGRERLALPLHHGPAEELSHQPPPGMGEQVEPRLGGKLVVQRPDEIDGVLHRACGEGAVLQGQHVLSVRREEFLSQVDLVRPPELTEAPPSGRGGAVQEEEHRPVRCESLARFIPPGQLEVPIGGAAIKSRSPAFVLLAEGVFFPLLRDELRSLARHINTEEAERLEEDPADGSPLRILPGQPHRQLEGPVGAPLPFPGGDQLAAETLTRCPEVGPVLEFDLHHLVQLGRVHRRRRRRGPDGGDAVGARRSGFDELRFFLRGAEIFGAGDAECDGGFVIGHGLSLHGSSVLIFD